MRRIALISDTHGSYPEQLAGFFDTCDEIWHAGDIGNMETALKLESFRPLKAVHGNIDGQDVRMQFPAQLRFYCEDVDVMIIHIGGYPGHYNQAVRQELMAHPPKLFICGHSHILRIVYDKKLDFLYLNPGAAGQYGFHTLCTALRFVIDGVEIREMEIWQMERGLRRDGGTDRRRDGETERRWDDGTNR